MTTRREFIRNTAVATAAAAAGMSLPGDAANIVTEGDLTTLKWDKAPCRFCGTGCGVNVAVKNGRVVATHGDVHAEVNRGINCVKGYFLSKIMYGGDRLTMPLLRKKNGVYAKDGDFERITTSLKNAQGERVMGTKLGKQHPAFATVSSGQPYAGRAVLFGRPYMTYYDPIKSDSGQLVGLLFVGFDLDAFDKAMDKMAAGAKFFETGGIPIVGIVENMAGYACPHCGEISDPFGIGGAEHVAHEKQIPFLGRVPLTMAIRTASDEGHPPAAGEGPEAEAFASIAARLTQWLDG